MSSFRHRFGVELDSFGRSFVERPPPASGGGAITFADVLAAVDWRELHDPNEQADGDGNPVDLLVDQTGNGFSYSAGGTARPTFRATGLGGAASLEYDGTLSVMTADQSAPLPQKWSFVAVVEVSGQTNSYVWSMIGGASGGGPCVLSRFGAEDLEYSGQTTGLALVQRLIKASAPAGPHIVAAICDGATNTITLRYDGADVLTANDERDWSGAGAAGNRYGASTVATLKFNGQIGPRGFADEALGPSQLATVEGYYADLYGITLP